MSVLPGRGAAGCVLVFLCVCLLSSGQRQSIIFPSVSSEEFRITAGVVRPQGTTGAHWLPRGDGRRVVFTCVSPGGGTQHNICTFVSRGRVGGVHAAPQHLGPRGAPQQRAALPAGGSGDGAAALVVAREPPACTRQGLAATHEDLRHTVRPRGGVRSAGGNSFKVSSTDIII